MKIALVNAMSSGLDLIDVIKERGHDLLEVNIGYGENKQDKGHVYANNIEKALETLLKLSPDIILPGCERAVSDANYLAHKLGLPHNDIRRQNARKDKALMIDALVDYGIPAVKSFRITSDNELDHIPALSYPVVVKPVASSGSDLVKIIKCQEELIVYLNDIFETNNRWGIKNTSVVVQEFLNGPMYVVNTVSQNGVHLLTDIYFKDIAYFQGMPLSLSMILCVELNETLRNIVNYTFDCLDSLGVSTGAAHTEIILTENGPRLVEVNSRLMGPAMPSDIFVPALGYSQASILVDSYNNIELFLSMVEKKWKPKMCIAQCQIRPNKDGVIYDMVGLDYIRNLPGFSGFRKLPYPGMKVQDRFLTTASTGIAYFRHSEPELIKFSINKLHHLCKTGKVFGIA
ncbi:ATP-grasp domain-containing protein [Xenorhabdus doucetiae]|uniref:ATP-grasp domain-containing protein n=1 Tax=Xenorhabdus doucetiae TaxID=351671 RepID=A0A068QWW1_9GAMM|nr:ATP-grasp domain-containing protein [Xenorhabdus doucetiae]TYP04726.1 ATP-grasp domain-containing protein [Xenorhabdus doucetiae]CDG19468.1 putative Phosphoribosylglycinamide synthetase [Xenorhabdus doucetiae]